MAKRERMIVWDCGIRRRRGKLQDCVNGGDFGEIPLVVGNLNDEDAWQYFEGEN